MQGQRRLQVRRRRLRRARTPARARVAARPSSTTAARAPTPARARAAASRATTAAPARTPARARAAAACPSSPRARHLVTVRGRGELVAAPARFRLPWSSKTPVNVSTCPTSASASACAPSTSATSSSTGRRSTGSRSSPRTSWTPGAAPPACSTRWRSAIRWSSTACRCPSAAPIPSTATYLGKLKALADRTRAHWVSDHLCWTGVMGRNTHDLLPMPYTEEALRHTVARVKQVSEILERPLVLENPSSYVEFAASTMHGVGVPAPARRGGRLRAAARRQQRLRVVRQPFLRPRRLHRRHPRRPRGAVPPGRPHPQGHPHPRHPQGHALPEVWDLYRRAWARTGPTATLYEWDEDIPAFEVVHAEAKKALAHRGEAILPERHKRPRPRAGPVARGRPMSALPLPLDRLQRWMQDVIVHPGPVDEAVAHGGGAGRGAPTASGRRDPALAHSCAPKSASRSTTACTRCACATPWPATTPASSTSWARRLRALRRRLRAGHPSRSYTLNRLGDHVPDFIRRKRGLKHREFLLRPRPPRARGDGGLRRRGDAAAGRCRGPGGARGGLGGSTAPAGGFAPPARAPLPGERVPGERQGREARPSPRGPEGRPGSRSTAATTGSTARTCRERRSPCSRTLPEERRSVRP